MKNLKFSKQTGIISLVFFIAYFFYGMFRIPFLQFVTCMAVAGITYGVTNSFEISLIGLLAMNLIFPMFSGAITKREGFSGFSNAEEISGRIRSMKGRSVAGIGSPMSEGFEDADSSDMTLSKKPSDNSESVTATSIPASVKEEKEEKEEKPKEKEEFENQAGLFKLGKIPKDTKGGFHIDAGTTVINALNSLKPDQINAMTTDTKQLIETQKSLMNLLQTFTPMVSEGKQMMDTFNTMFTPAMGSMKTAQGMLGGQ